MHDWKLERITIDWGSGEARAFVRSPKGSEEIRVSGLREIRVPRREDWGPSVSINTVDGPNRSDDGLLHLNIEMQSGDMIEIVAESIEMPRAEHGKSLSMLRFGLFQNFKGPRKTLLLWGNDPGIASLQKMFQELAAGAQKRIPLHEMQWAEGIDNAHLVLALEPSGCNAAINLSATSRSTTIKWSGPPDEFDRYAELIAPLMNASCSEGHQYLDSIEGFPLQVIVSKGKYPDSFGGDR